MKKIRTNNIKVIKNEENPETPEVLASSLIQIGKAMEMLSRQKGGLTHEAIAVLVCNMRGNSNLSKYTVLMVIEGLSRLKSYYIRK